MKKVILTKSNSKTITTALKITSPDNAKSKSAYAELFRVVLQIPEKDVQLRILDAVNGKSSSEQIIHAMCPNCKKTFGNSSNSFKENATQTDITEVVEPKSTGDQLSKVNDPINSPLKRKRKRKVCLPQVVKRSHAQMAHTQLQPKLKTRKMEQVRIFHIYVHI